MKKYQTATTEQRAGARSADGTPIAPQPPDDSGTWRLVGLHAFMRESEGSDPFGVIDSAAPEWFVHFYWERACTERSAEKSKPAPTPIPGKGRIRSPPMPSRSADAITSSCCLTLRSELAR